MHPTEGLNTKKIFDPNKIIDYSADYYAILGLERGDLPEGRSYEEEFETRQTLAKAYKNAARRCHPNFKGGSAAAFRKVVEAQTVLADWMLRKMYHAGGDIRAQFVGDGSVSDAFNVNWEKLGAYRQGTLADTEGYNLFFSISEQREEWGLLPAFHPSDNSHAYEWDWVIEGEDAKLALSLVHDADEVLRLTSGDDIDENSVPFKIYICIPRASLYFQRDPDEVYVYDDGSEDVMPGHLRAACYSDYGLLETTNLASARDYIADPKGLQRHLALFRDGTLPRVQTQMDKQAKQTIWQTSQKMQSVDTDMLRDVLRAKNYQLTTDLRPNENADEILDRLPG